MYLVPCIWIYLSSIFPIPDYYTSISINFSTVTIHKGYLLYERLALFQKKELGWYIFIDSYRRYSVSGCLH